MELHKLTSGPLGVILNALCDPNRERDVVRVFQNLRLVSKGMSTAMLPLAPMLSLTFDRDDDNRRMGMYRQLMGRMNTVSTDTYVHLRLISEEDVRRCLALIAAFPRAWTAVRSMLVANRMANTSWMSYAAHYFSSVRDLKIHMGHSSMRFVVEEELLLFRSLDKLCITGHNTTSTFVWFELPSLNLAKLNIQRCTLFFREGMTLGVTEYLVLRNCGVTHSIPQHVHVSGMLHILETTFVSVPPAQPIVFDADAFLGVQTAHLGRQMATFFLNHPAYFRNVTDLTVFVDTSQTFVPSWATVFEQGPRDLESLCVQSMHNDQLDALTRLPRLKNLELSLLDPDPTRALHAVVCQLNGLESLTFDFARHSFSVPNAISVSLNLCSYVASLKTAARASGIRLLTLRLYDCWSTSNINLHHPGNQEGVHYHTIHEGAP